MRRASGYLETTRLSVHVYDLPEICFYFEIAITISPRKRFHRNWAPRNFWRGSIINKNVLINWNFHDISCKNIRLESIAVLWQWDLKNKKKNYTGNSFGRVTGRVCNYLFCNHDMHVSVVWNKTVRLFLILRASNSVHRLTVNIAKEIYSWPGIPCLIFYNNPCCYT